MAMERGTALASTAVISMLAARQRPLEKTCRRCGVRFTLRGTQSRRMDCDACQPIVRRERRARKERIRARAARREFKRIRRLVHRRRTVTSCPTCGREFWPWKNGKHQRKHCSRRCADAAQHRHRPEFATVWPRLCAWCERPFIARIKNKRSCSTECGKRLVTRRKRLRRKGLRAQPAISLSKIYRRDKGRCYLCRQHVSQRFVPPDKRSATLDHVIPLARGGEHSEANVRLAHYGCNSSKGDRPTLLF